MDSACDGTTEEKIVWTELESSVPSCTCYWVLETTFGGFSARIRKTRDSSERRVRIEDASGYIVWRADGVLDLDAAKEATEVILRAFVRAGEILKGTPK